MMRWRFGLVLTGVAVPVRPIGLTGLVLLAQLVFAPAAHAQGVVCPGDTAARLPATLLTVELPGQPVRALSRSDLLALTAEVFTVGRSVEQGGRKQDDSLRYRGVRLRDLLSHAGLDESRNRAARNWVFELTASDNYRAYFSWGELFNHAAGESVAVIYEYNGQPLDTTSGPLALRALTDQRPGPRHVRNLCALRARELP